MPARIELKHSAQITCAAIVKEPASGAGPESATTLPACIENSACGVFHNRSCVENRTVLPVSVTEPTSRLSSRLSGPLSVGVLEPGQRRRGSRRRGSGEGEKAKSAEKRCKLVHPRAYGLSRELGRRPGPAWSRCSTPISVVMRPCRACTHAFSVVVRPCRACAHAFSVVVRPCRACTHDGMMKAAPKDGLCCDDQG